MIGKRLIRIPSYICLLISTINISGINGEFGLVFGTSASSPVVGSLITLINDARLAIGKGPVGFINPAVRMDTIDIWPCSDLPFVDLLCAIPARI